MTPFAESVFESPIHSVVEAKLRQLLIENADRILGIQVCAYKDGQVIIDTAAGVLGEDDPNPVQPDTLFPVFSATKSVTAGMLHWLADKGKLNLDEYVANIWPEFATNGKDKIKVHHILNHTSGLHNALAGISEDDPALLCDWDVCVKRIAMVTHLHQRQHLHLVVNSYTIIFHMVGYVVGSFSPIHSVVEDKLRRLLVELGNADRILGIQVCAYKDGQVIIDTAAGVLGEDDPNPVQPDSLFCVFSATKGVTAGILHWLVDKGKLKLDEYVANIWPEFATNGKDKIKVHHILNHTSGLHNTLAGISEDDPALLCDWDECVKRIAMVAPETEPGSEQLYHYLSYGWLCGGIIEHASGKKFQDILEEAIVRPLNVEGELYIGIPPGVESRLASLTFDKTEFSIFAALSTNAELRAATGTPSTLTTDLIAGLIPLSNTLNVRRAIIPAVNGHFSARALARYYAALADGGAVPPRHSTTLPPLGSHPHHPTNPKSSLYTGTPDSTNTSDGIDMEIFSNPKSKIHDAFLGSGDFKELILPDGRFGLGFRRVNRTDGAVIGFGHAGLGGSTGYCDINNRFSIAVTLNKLSFGALTAEIIQFVCSELDLPVPEDYAGSRGFIEKPVIN